MQVEQDVLIFDFQNATHRGISSDSCWDFNENNFTSLHFIVCSWQNKKILIWKKVQVLRIANSQTPRNDNRAASTQTTSCIVQQKPLLSALAFSLRVLQYLDHTFGNTRTRCLPEHRCKMPHPIKWCLPVQQFGRLFF